MPIYEYICSQCGNEFEKLMRFSDPDINSPQCPHCQSESTNKRMSRIAAMGSLNTSAGSSNASCGSSGGFR